MLLKSTRVKRSVNGRRMPGMTSIPADEHQRDKSTGAQSLRYRVVRVYVEP
jgi:hypothetical protein